MIKEVRNFSNFNTEMMLGYEDAWNDTYSVTSSKVDRDYDKGYNLCEQDGYVGFGKLYEEYKNHTQQGLMEVILFNNPEEVTTCYATLILDDILGNDPELSNPQYVKANSTATFSLYNEHTDELISELSFLRFNDIDNLLNDSYNEDFMLHSLTINDRGSKSILTNSLKEYINKYLEQFNKK